MKKKKKRHAIYVSLLNLAMSTNNQFSIENNSIQEGGNTNSIIADTSITATATKPIYVLYTFHLSSE